MNISADQEVTLRAYIATSTMSDNVKRSWLRQIAKTQDMDANLARCQSLLDEAKKRGTKQMIFATCNILAASTLIFFLI